MARVRSPPRSGGSATWRCGSPPRLRRSGARRRFAIASSTRRCRRSPISAPGRRAATPIASTASATIFSSSTTPAAASRFGAQPEIVGTYRLLRQEVAERHGGFYSAGEFDLAPLLRAQAAICSFLELGRSCVLPAYRNKRTLELLWHGIWAYVLQARRRRDDRLRQPGRHRSRTARAAAFLPASHAARRRNGGSRAHADRRVEMNRMPRARDRRAGGAPRAAAADQGISAARRV